MATLAEIRAKLQESNQGNSSGARSGGDNAIFAHWNIPEDSTATVRFLPDGDSSNSYFWVERQMINLTFAGVVGDPSSRNVEVPVPCVEMWGQTCPILTEVRPWWKDKSLEKMASKYWKKRSYIFQGFVVDPGKYQEDNIPENPIRRFAISQQIFAIIKKALMDPEMEELPTDYVRGVDLKISKIMKPGGDGKMVADYTTSSWSRRERALNENEQAAIKQYGLYDLKNFMPKKPTDVELKVMMEMFEASVNGDAFDMARWGQYFKPKGYRGNGDASAAPAAVSKPVATPAAVVNDDEDDAPVSTPTRSEPVQQAAPASDGASSSSRAQEIIARLRNRNAQ